MDSVFGTEFGTELGGTHTKGYGMGHPWDVPNIIPSSEVPWFHWVHVLAVDQQVAKGAELGHNAKAVPVLFQRPGIKPLVVQQEPFSKG